MVKVHVVRCALSHVLHARWPRSLCVVRYDMRRLGARGVLTPLAQLRRRLPRGGPFSGRWAADSNPGHYSPLAAHHSPRTTHQLTTLHSPLTTRHAPLPCSTPKLQACARALPPARRAAHVPPPAQQLFIPHPPLSHRPRPPPAPLASPHASSHLLRSTLATPRTERRESLSLSRHPSFEPT